MLILLLELLNITDCESVTAIVKDDGCFLPRHESEVEEQVRLGLELMEKRRTIFESLARM